MKIICEKCESSFKYEAVKNMECCPVCGERFESVSSNDEEYLCKELGHPDLYYYDIDEVGIRTDNLRYVWCQCTSCKKVNTILYNKFDTVKSEYLHLKKDLDLTCKGCGKTITNLVIPPRPDGWRELNMWEKDYKNIPKCPICSSTKIHKISMTNKAASIVTFGIFAAGHVSKTYKCDVCGSKF